MECPKHSLLLSLIFTIFHMSPVFYNQYATLTAKQTLNYKSQPAAILAILPLLWLAGLAYSCFLRTNATVIQTLRNEIIFVQIKYSLHAYISLEVWLPIKIPYRTALTVPKPFLHHINL
jgi:hypothetical protein